MATTPDLQEPQIAAARAQAWHHTGDALLTLEVARTWLNDYGLVFFAPHPALGAPAPSLVEATLGTAKANIVLADTETARTLSARLVGEGSALPLNLLGGPGDLPDFLVSAHAFPFVFTLRGDKGWKRPPETSGAVKVTPLGLRVYELLAEKGALTIAAIVPEIGREVTESAIARALSELWQLLRVIPVLQQGEGETLWELTTTRFLKAVKAGANAGQPTALSALASLYLTQALVATEEEIASFLSPLTARSRVRDVLHGLTAGRQLAEGVVDGKSVLYMPDALPDFAQFAEPEPDVEVEDAGAETDSASEGEGSEETSGEQPPRERIQKFKEPSVRPQDRNLRGKPVSREGARDSFRSKSDRPSPGGFTRAPRTDRGSDARGGGAPRSVGPRTDRPVRREGTGEGFERRRPSSDRPSFNRPWDEDRASRPPRSRDAGAASDRPGRPPRRTADSGGDAREGRPSRPFADRTDSRPPRRDGDRPFRSRDSSVGGKDGGERPQRPFRPRPEGGDRPFRPRPEGGERPFRPRAESGERPFRPRPEGGERPFRPRTESGDRPFRPRPEGGDRPFRPRTESGDRPFRPRPEGGDRPFRARPASGDRPFRPREGGPSRGTSGAPRERRAPGGPPSSRFGGGERPKRPFSAGAEGGRSRPSFGRSGEGRPPRAEGSSGRSGDRSSFRPGGAGFRPGAKRAGSKPPNRPDRPARPPRSKRPEDEA